MNYEEAKQEYMRNCAQIDVESFIPQMIFANYEKPFRIHIGFSNGVQGVVNFSQWIKKAYNIFEPMKEEREFAKVTLNSDGDTIAWPNGADLAPEVLYNKIKEAKSGVAVY